VRSANTIVREEDANESISWLLMMVYDILIF
jgi:hypothetical protein